MKALRSLTLLLMIIGSFVACEKEAGNPVLTNPLPPPPVPGPSEHTIISEFYFQLIFASGDTVTLQTEDTTAEYVNVSQDLCFCTVIDSVNGMDTLIGYHYSPSTAIWPKIAFQSTSPLTYKNVGGIAFSREAKLPITDLLAYQQIVGRDSLGGDWGRVANTPKRDNGDDGVSVYYVDENGGEWASDNGLTLQNDSWFNVRSYTENTFGGEAWRMVDAEFKCTLYNDTSGAAREVIYGQMRGRIITWN